MPKQTTKAQILKDIVTERRQLENNIASLSPEQVIAPGACGEWSVKDLMAHLVAWEQLFTGWYESGVRGDPIPQELANGLKWSEMHELNRQFYEKNRDRTLEDVTAEFHSSYQKTLALVESIPEVDIFNPGRFGWTGKWGLAGFITANTCNHYRWAKTLIRKWKKGDTG